MSLSLTSKALVGIASATTLGGLSYGAYLQFATTSDIKEALIKKLRTPLDLNAINGEDFEHWQELVKQHNSGKPEGKTKIDNLDLSGSNGVQALKNKCKELLSTKKDNSNFEKNLSDADNWCTSQSAPRKISSLLNKRNRILLSKTDTTAWNKPWTDFKAKYQEKAPEGNWEISEWAGIKTKPDVEQKFKDKCTSNGEMSIMLSNENSFLNEMEKYCTKEKNES